MCGALRCDDIQTTVYHFIAHVNRLGSVPSGVCVFVQNPIATRWMVYVYAVAWQCIRTPYHGALIELGSSQCSHTVCECWHDQKQRKRRNSHSFEFNRKKNNFTSSWTLCVDLCGVCVSVYLSREYRSNSVLLFAFYTHRARSGCVHMCVWVNGVWMCARAILYTKSEYAQGVLRTE